VRFGNSERATATTDHIRFVEHSIDGLRRNHRLKPAGTVMPSHMHDDHLNGFPHLMRRHGTRLWRCQNMVAVLERPRGYNLGCILGEPLKVGRSFRHGEKFRWEEFEFEVTHSPGHTEYQMALFATIDGNRVAFTGDAFFDAGRKDGVLRHNLIFRNHVENDSHVKSIRILIDRAPNLIAPPEWRIEPDVVRFEVPANATGSRPLSLSIPKNWAPRSSRLAIAADVMADGKYLGEVTEAVVDLKGAESF
jgi:hypothetical protein